MVCLRLGGRQLIGTPGDCCGQDEFAFKEEEQKGQTVYGRRYGTQKFEWTLWPTTWVWLTSTNTLFHTCVAMKKIIALGQMHIEVRRKKNGSSRSAFHGHSKSSEPSTDTDRLGTYDFRLFITRTLDRTRTVSEISGDLGHGLSALALAFFIRFAASVDRYRAQR